MAETCKARSVDVPKTEEQFIDWCTNDPRYFLEACTKIKCEDERGIPFITEWRFNKPQTLFYNSVYKYTDKHFVEIVVPDTIMLKSRQWGHTTEIIGDMWHGFVFYASVGKIICYRDATAKKLKRILDLFYTSTRACFANMGLDPDEHLPYAKLDNMHELYCETTGAVIEFTTEGAKGEGRSATVNRIYGTEYPEWRNVSDVMSGYGGSLAKVGARVDLDGTGKGVGNAFYREYQAASRGKAGSAGGSVYKSFFFGRNDFEYPPRFLEKQRLRLKNRFDQEYPATDEQAFRQDDNALWSRDDIDACGLYDLESGEYHARYLNSDANLSTLFYSHGCDPESGVPTGSKTAIVTREITSREMACEPLNDFKSPRETAFEIRRRVEIYPGIVVIEENNHGHAVIQKCEDLSLRSGPFKGEKLSRFLYRQPKPGTPLHQCRIGWDENKDNKVLLEENYEEHLCERLISMPCAALRQQAGEYCRNENGKTGKPLIKTEDGGDFYDDLVIADMLCLQGLAQAARVKARATSPQVRAVSGGSMRDDRQLG